METNPSIDILDLGPAIDTLKSLSCKFRETGDYMYMMEILLLIDEIESPVLIELLEPDFIKAEA
jgi:hypothetical protein|tara:strand:+ start:145 stop:336 length:192 start_codon:yes stop_codon:yes gene_type:complete